MSTMQLYQGLIDATRNIVNQYGKDVLKEERFVYILADMYPDRDSPALFRIIKSAIQDGIINALIDTNVQTIEFVVSNLTSSLTKKFGYDSMLAEGVLYSLAVGSGVISIDNYNSLKHKNNNPPQKKNAPSKKQISNPNNNPPQKKNNNYDFNTTKYIALLIWAFLGLLVSPVVYALLICRGEWWPLPSSILVALIHLLTIIPVIAYFTDNNTKIQSNYPYVGGALCAILGFAIVFWVAFPLLWGFEDIQELWGLKNSEGFPGELTIVFNIICAMVLGVGLLDYINTISYRWNRHNYSYWKAFIDLLAIRSFRNGFLTTCAVIFFAGLFACAFPFTNNLQRQKDINDLNTYILNVNHQKDSLRNVRSKQDRILAFADFCMGMDFSECLKIISSKKDYIFEQNMKKSPDKNLCVNGVEYESIVDNNLELSTEWDNDSINIELFFSHQKLIALSFTPYKINGDSIISIYTQKYGEPEYHLQEFGEADELRLKYYGFESIKEDVLTPSEYYWTFKNYLLKMEIAYDMSSYYNCVKITYFARIAETYLNNKIKEEKRLQKIEEKRKNDSLKQVREKEERLKMLQKEREELNHKKSIKQI